MAAEVDFSDLASVAGSSKSKASRTSKGSSKKKRSIRSAKRVDGSVDVNESKEHFTQEILSAGLSQLGRSADGLNPAYLRLDVVGTDLENTVVFSNLSQIQTAILSDNRLQDIRTLGALANLTHVDVSGNQLSQVLDLGPPYPSISSVTSSIPPTNTSVSGSAASSGGNIFIPPSNSAALPPSNLPLDPSTSSKDSNFPSMLGPLSSSGQISVSSGVVTGETASAAKANLQGKATTGVNGSPDSPRALNVRFADFSRNRIQTIRDLSCFHRLTDLRLDYNGLTFLGSALSALRMLQRFSATCNQLTSCEGLQELSSLKYLDLSYNQIASLAPLSPLIGLQTLRVRCNQVSSLMGVDRLTSLRHLDAAFNQVLMLEEAAAARWAPLLGRVDLEGNPFCDCFSARLHLVHLLPQASLVDGLPVSAQEKVRSGNIHGEDSVALKRIRKHFFAEGELDDGGG
eukprot:CAMPEP_0175056620 /NCGR_PEP_ID=MMETSP0052_2-20121109/10781_1 /TAXON_ID=51329 ORGANISM="Polytomella parva, Strain SAG 63-3" /NCGR_SAMPLE_ID=MMETSP0052_2 /ASSEMBLY_ACC=CAM_ASM_000194 /LENGTH=457 /DNA_ID=CAMNT_0016321685 /DNA_START=44 /DNA_END=1413 /DNA_ORIENTATION=-